MRRNMLALGLAAIGKALYRQKYYVAGLAVSVAIFTNAQYFYTRYSDADSIERELENQTERLASYQRQIEITSNSLVMDARPVAQFTPDDEALVQVENLNREAAVALERAENVYMNARRALNAGAPVNEEAIRRCYKAIVAYSPKLVGLRQKANKVEYKIRRVKPNRATTPPGLAAIQPIYTGA